MWSTWKCKSRPAFSSSTLICSFIRKTPLQIFKSKPNSLFGQPACVMGEHEHKREAFDGERIRRTGDAVANVKGAAVLRGLLLFP